jgi:hypothetical protein
MLTTSSPRYCEKIAQRYLPNELILCLIGFPSRLVKQFSKHIDNIASFLGAFQSQNSALFNIYYEKRDETDALGI